MSKVINYEQIITEGIPVQNIPFTDQANRTDVKCYAFPTVKEFGKDGVKESEKATEQISRNIDSEYNHSRTVVFNPGWISE